jgi:hypothetical protein
MTWRGVLEFTFRLRWHALYLLKTRQTLPEDAPLWKIIPHVIASRTMHLIRNTVRRFKDARREPAILASVALDWALFPFVLPYMIYWHARFVRVLRERVAQSQNPAASPRPAHEFSFGDHPDRSRAPGRWRPPLQGKGEPAVCSVRRPAPTKRSTATSTCCFSRRMPDA